MSALKFLPGAIFFILAIACWFAAFGSSDSTAAAEPEKLKPWTIVCDHHGAWSYTDEYGEISTDNLKSRKDAEDRMSYWKRWTDEFNARDHAAERAAREKIRADRAKQFTVCNDTAAIKDETGAGKLVKLGDLPSDVKTVEVDGLKFRKEEPKSRIATLDLKVGDKIPGWGTGKTYSIAGDGTITDVIDPFKDSNRVATVDPKDLVVPKELIKPASESDLIIGTGTFTSPSSICFAGITIDLHTGEVKGTDNLSEAAQEFWKAVTTAFPDFKRSIIEGK